MQDNELDIVTALEKAFNAEKQRILEHEAKDARTIDALNASIAALNTGPGSPGVSAEVATRLKALMTDIDQFEPATQSEPPPSAPTPAPEPIVTPPPPAPVETPPVVNAEPPAPVPPFVPITPEEPAPVETPTPEPAPPVTEPDQSALPGFPPIGNPDLTPEQGNTPEEPTSDQGGAPVVTAEPTEGQTLPPDAEPMPRATIHGGEQVSPGFSLPGAQPLPEPDEASNR